LNGIAFFCIFAVLVIVVIVFTQSAGRKQTIQEEILERERIERKFNSVAGFTPSQRFVSPDQRILVALDESSRKLFIVTERFGTPQIIAPDDVLAAELVEDGVTVTSTDRGSQVLGAAVGGALFGGLGAVVGGLSASSTGTNKTQRLDLKVVVNDISQPVRMIPFLNSAAGVEKSSPEYQEARQQAFHWHAILSLVIKQPASGA
jgi:hypothetical protein